MRKGKFYDIASAIFKEYVEKRQEESRDIEEYIQAILDIFETSAKESDCWNKMVWKLMLKSRSGKIYTCVGYNDTTYEWVGTMEKGELQERVEKLNSFNYDYKLFRRLKKEIRKLPHFTAKTNGAGALMVILKN